MTPAMGDGMGKCLVTFAALIGVRRVGFDAEGRAEPIVVR